MRYQLKAKFSFQQFVASVSAMISSRSKDATETTKQLCLVTILFTHV